MYNAHMTSKILNSPLEQLTRTLFSKVIERLAVVVSNENLSFSQVAALHIIDREKAITINDIATRLNLSLSATSRLIDELVKQELLDRTEDRENRRSKILTLSSEGKKFMNSLSIERVKIFEESVSLFTDKIPGKLMNILSSKKNKIQREATK